MGKRELLLIVAFVIVGAVVYQATAPPAGPNERSFSFSRLLEHVRREMRGNRARAELTTVTTYDLTPGTTEVRIAGSYAELTITGENRSNIEARLRVTSNGFDDAEAKKLAGETRLEVDRTGGVLRLTSMYPDPGQQRAFLTLVVPARLNLRVDQGSGRTTVTNVASVEIPGIRGETSLKQIAGLVNVTQRSGRILVEDVAALKLTARGCAVTVTKVRGSAWFSLQHGEMKATDLGGAIDVEVQNAEVTLRKLDGAKGPMRMNAVGGRMTLEGLRADARIEGRNTKFDIEMAKPAVVTVYNEGGEPIEIVAPPGGFTLDAVVTSWGRIEVPDALRNQITMSGKEDDQERRATGAVRGGGPALTIRAKHGDIRIRTNETSNSER